VDGQGPTLRTGTGDEIRCLAFGTTAIYVLDSKGRLMFWPGPSATVASLLHAVTCPGYSLATATVQGIECVVLTEDAAVTCRAAGAHSAVRTFQSPGDPLSMAAACEDYVAALNWGTRPPETPNPTIAYLWKWDEPAAPAIVWPIFEETGHHAQDIALRTE
jgi:hypothetical protein